jgi:4-carboxymuconolactone decarboxylase
MDETSKYDIGVRTLAEINPGKPEQLRKAIDDIAPGLGRSLLEFGYGDLLVRPGLALRDRLLVPVVALAVLGLTDQLPSHVDDALRVGYTPEQIVEILVTIIPFAGFARAINAISVARQAFPDS